MTRIVEGLLAVKWWSISFHANDPSPLTLAPEYSFWSRDNAKIGCLASLVFRRVDDDDAEWCFFDHISCAYHFSCSLGFHGVDNTSLCWGGFVVPIHTSISGWRSNRPVFVTDGFVGMQLNFFQPPLHSYFSTGYLDMWSWNWLWAYATAFTR